MKVGLPHRGFTRALTGDDILVVPELPPATKSSKCAKVCYRGWFENNS